MTQLSETELDIAGQDIDQLLDRTIDNLADYVPFEPFPVGTYKLQFGYEKTTVGDNDLPTLRVTLTLQEVIEIPKASDKAPEEGRKVVKSYVLMTKEGKRNTISEGQLKAEILAPLKEVFGGEMTSEILHNGDGCSVIATLGIRKRKNKETGEIMAENTIKALVVDQ